MIIPIKPGGGTDTSDATAVEADVLSPKTFYGADGEKHTGEIVTNNDSGNVTLNTSTTSKSFAAGYYPNAHGAAITLEEKSATPSTTAQDITPSSGKVLNKVTVNAIPNQKADSGNVTLNASTTSKSYAAGYYANAHGAQVTLYNGSVS